MGPDYAPQDRGCGKPRSFGMTRMSRPSRNPAPEYFRRLAQAALMTGHPYGVWQALTGHGYYKQVNPYGFSDPGCLSGVRRVHNDFR